MCNAGFARHFLGQHDPPGFVHRHLFRTPADQALERSLLRISARHGCEIPRQLRHLFRGQHAQAGAFLGYASFGFLADRFGRRPVFIGFLLAASLLVPVYGGLAHHRILLLLLGPLVGFFGHGYFSVFGALLAELFPTRIRGTAQGLTYNVGRALSALAPLTVGSLADQYGLGGALTITSAFFLAGAGLMLFLPETRGRQLET